MVVLLHLKFLKDPILPREPYLHNNIFSQKSIPKTLTQFGDFKVTNKP